MNNLGKFITAAAVGCVVCANAQTFEPLDRKYFPDKYDLVDTLLLNGNKIGTLPQAGDLHYIIDFNEPAYDAYDYSRSHFSYPATSYVVTKLPGDAGDFYGFYTTGFEKSEEVYTGKSKTGSIIYGTVVRPDGSRETLILRPEAAWKKLAVSKPTGTFYIHDYNNDFKTVELVFNAGGTGRIIYHMPRSYHQAPQEIGGMSTQRHANGRIKKRHRSFTGGYRFYMDGTITTPMKWKYADGELSVTPTGKATTAVSGGIDYERTWAGRTVTESDKRIENGKFRADFPTNEYVVEAKKAEKVAADEYATSLSPMEFPVVHMTQKEILIGLNSKSVPGKYYYVMDRKKESDPMMTYGLEALGTLFDTYSKAKRPAVSRLYDIFVKNGKIGISMAQAPLSSALTYKVYDINPIDRTARISFIVPSHVYDANLSFDSRWHVDNAQLQSSLTEDNTIADNRALIAANNERILEYKKDKRRSKIVKKYEKYVKNMTQPETFYTIEQYEDLCSLQKRLLEIQAETLKALE